MTADKLNPVVVPVILSGGMGTRLWPLSRASHPKQFLRLADQRYSLIQQTMLRVMDRDVFAAPIFVTNEDHRFLVAEHAQELGMHGAKILLEPVARNTAPALAMAAHYIRQHYGDDAVMLALPSDHIITDEEAFKAAVVEGVKTTAKGYLTTFGITPDCPETGYGYIRIGQNRPILDRSFEVNAFVEKPDQETAENYLESGDYVWNSGIFAFNVTQLLNEIHLHHAEMAKQVAIAFNTMREGEDFVRFGVGEFAAIPADSIDYAVMEHTQDAAVVPVSCGWTDAGSWDALWKVKAKDADGNASDGNNQFVDAQNCYVNSADGVDVSVLGLENVAVIATKDSVLVVDRSKAQDVKKLVDLLKKKDAKKVNEYRQMYRPWGNYDSIGQGDNHQVKRIAVKPGASLSIQMHHHRAEHWIVVKGTAVVTVGEEDKVLTENQSVYIPKGAKHRLVNRGSEILELIEVQYGTYLGEDDIVRFEDTYGRIAEVM